MRPIPLLKRFGKPKTLTKVLKTIDNLIQKSIKAITRIRTNNTNGKTRCLLEEVKIKMVSSLIKKWTQV